MNATTHRLIFNASRGCMMVVSESAKSPGKGGTRNKRLASRRRGSSSQQNPNSALFQASKIPEAPLIHAQAAINSIANSNLHPGIALSAAQMAVLTADIVWLVAQDG